VTRPCVGCGYCCFSAQCGLSYERFGCIADGQRCPGLKWVTNRRTGKGRYVCTAIRNPFDASELAIGAGCCSGLNTWRLNVRERKSVLDNAEVFYG